MKTKLRMILEIPATLLVMVLIVLMVFWSLFWEPHRLGVLYVDYVGLTLCPATTIGYWVLGLFLEILVAIIILFIIASYRVVHKAMFGEDR